MSELGKLSVILEAKSSKFLTEMELAEKKFEKTTALAEKMGKQISDIGKGFAIFGGVIVGAMGFAVKSLANTSDEILNLSQRTGLGTTALQELKYAVELSGGSLGELEIGMKKMSATIYDASSGMDTASASLKSIGLSVTDLQGLKPEEQFDLIAKRVAGVKDEITRAAIAQDIFGRSGTTLLPMLADGAAGFDKLKQEAHKYTKVLTPEEVKNAESFGDELDKLKMGATALAQTLGTSLLPMVSEMIIKIQDIGINIREWIKEHQILFDGLSKSIAVIGAVALGIGTFLVVLGKMIALAPAVQTAWQLIGGPPLWVATAIIALIAVGVLLWKHWEETKFLAQSIWMGIKTIILLGIKGILEGMNLMLGWIPKFGDRLKNSLSAINNEILELDNEFIELRNQHREEMFAKENEDYEESFNSLGEYYNNKEKLEEENNNEVLNGLEEYSAEKEKIEQENQALAYDELGKNYDNQEQLEADRLEKVRDQIKKGLEDKKLIFDEERKLAIANAEEIGLDEDEINEYYDGLERERRVALVQEYLQTVSNMTSQLGSIFSQYYTNQGMEIDADAQKKKDAVTNSLMTEEEKASAIKSIDEETTKQKKKMAREQAVTEKALAIFNIIINTAQAIAKTIGVAGFFGIPLAVIVGAMGAAQLALVAAQPLPALAEGGLAFGPSLAMVGDNAGAMTDPEVISPLSKLSSMMGGEQTIIINLDGRQIAKSTAQNFPSVLKLYGAAI